MCLDWKCSSIILILFFMLQDSVFQSRNKAMRLSSPTHLLGSGIVLVSIVNYNNNKQLSLHIVLLERKICDATGSQAKTTTKSCVTKQSRPPSYVATRDKYSREIIHSISAMPAYIDKSHEELRWETYESNKKGTLREFRLIYISFCYTVHAFSSFYFITN